MNEWILQVYDPCESHTLKRKGCSFVMLHCSSSKLLYFELWNFLFIVFQHLLHLLFLVFPGMDQLASEVISNNLLYFTPVCDLKCYQSKHLCTFCFCCCWKDNFALICSVGVVRVGESNGEFIVNPSWSQLATSGLNVVVACSESKVGEEFTTVLLVNQPNNLPINWRGVWNKALSDFWCNVKFS